MKKNRILIAVAILATAGFAACGTTDPDTVSSGLQTAAPVSADAAEQRAAPAAPRVAAAPVSADAADRRFTSEAAAADVSADAASRRLSAQAAAAAKSSVTPVTADAAERHGQSAARAPQTADAAERQAYA